MTPTQRDLLAVTTNNEETNQTTEHHTIYMINNTYQISKNEEDNTFNCKTKSGPIEKIVELLKKDRGYHIRIDDNKPCIVYVDLDHCKEESTFNSFCSVLCKVFDVTNDLISYTLSKKENEFSYHISIPCIECKSAKHLKKEFERYEFKEYVKDDNLDLSIYSNKWFRLPNQTNKIKPLAHNIIVGKIEDFIIHYVNETEYDLTITSVSQETTQPEDGGEGNLSTKEEEITKLLSCLDYRRYNYTDWFNIGCIIKNETNNINIWKNWSQYYSKYNEKEIEYKWATLSDKKDGLNIGTLVNYAKEDNIDLYTSITKKIKLEFNFNNEITTTSIADHFKSLYSDKFIYQDNKLYFFNGVYWKVEESNKLITLNNFIGTTYFLHLMALLRQYEEYKLKNTASKDVEAVVLKINIIRNTLLSLQNYDKRQKFISDILCKLYNDEIKFDMNPYLFAFNNKIFDLKQACFILPNPLDYVSLTTGYNFIEQNEEANIKEIHTLLDSIFPQPEIKKLYLTILSTGLDGIPLENFVIANGGGGNGKGLLNEFVEYMLGDYAYVLPSHILLNKIQSGSNPEMANMHKKRFVIAKEPDSELKFNTSTLKDITGGGNINARLNYSNNTKTILNLTLILECNDKPKLKESNDADALIRRILDIPFKNKFVDKSIYDELTEDEKKAVYLKNDYFKTTEFKDKFRQALFFVMVDHYKNYLINGRHLPIPEEILKRNRAYLASSDELYNWLEDKYEHTDNKKDIIKIKSLFEDYKTSQYFENLTKEQKRKNNYKSFVEKLESNFFIKKYVKENKDKIKILTNYEVKVEDEDDDNEDNFIDI